MEIRLRSDDMIIVDVDFMMIIGPARLVVMMP